MSRIALLAAALALPLAFIATPVLAHSHPRPASHHGHSMHAPAAKSSLQAAMRSLWHDHVVHAREYAFATHAGNNGAAQKANAAVVANAHQIAKAVGGFYGDGAGQRMFALLGGHWGAVKHITDAAHAHGDAGRTTAIGDLTANANEIATFLSGANPYLPRDAVFGLLAAHGGHHVAQIDQVMKGDTKGEAATWAAMQAHMDALADALAGGIARQFPAKAG